MEVIITRDYEEMSWVAAQIIRRQIIRKPDSVLGLATGGTPLGIYKELIRLHREEGLDFSKLTTFNLDEYLGLPPSHSQSYHYFMRENLFKQINISPTRIHIPNGMAEDIDSHCQWYEEEIKKAGGIDLQLLGIGSDGHIAFNEPGSSLGSRTRLKTLTESTIKDNARFFEREEDVPHFAITMGVGTIFEARSIVLAANGEKKAQVCADFIEGPVTARVTASLLQLHPRVHVVLDESAASKLKEAEYYRWVQDQKQKLSGMPSQVTFLRRPVAKK
jgi:glucosamine-6-phosphate deaminase